MEKKQTAVDYLVEQLFKIRNNTTEVKEMNSKSIIDQAKAMHKEESELLFECGRNFQLTGEGTFNKVYNETYGETKN